MHGGRINLSGQGKFDQETLYAVDRSFSASFDPFVILFACVNKQKMLQSIQKVTKFHLIAS